MSTQPQISFQIETITPDQARALLATNIRNRPISRHNIYKIADAIRAGTFHITGDAIRIGADGVLYDGQHRLLAVLQTNMPIETAVIRGLPENALMAIDGGKSRTRQEQIQIARSYATIISDTVIRLNGFTVSHRETGRLSTDEIASIIDQHPLIRETALAYVKAHKFGLGAQLPAGELALKAHGYQAEAEAWRTLWVLGDRSPMTRFAAAFRNRLIAAPHGPSHRRWTSTNKKWLLQLAVVATAADLPEPQQLKPREITLNGFSLTALLNSVDFANTTKTPVSKMSVAGGHVVRNRRERGNPDEPMLPMFPADSAGGPAQHTQIDMAAPVDEFTDWLTGRIDQDIEGQDDDRPVTDTDDRDGTVPLKP